MRPSFFVLLAALFLPLLAGTACARKTPMPELDFSGENSALASRLAPPNRTDSALRQTLQGWRFSALFQAGDKGGLPLLILLKRSPKQMPESVLPSFEAMILTETSMALCALSLDAEKITFRQCLPSSDVRRLCEETGTALRNLFFATQPGGLVGRARKEEKGEFRVFARTAEDGGTFFYYNASGYLVEKRHEGRDGSWTALYGDHKEQGTFFEPHSARYMEGGRVLRLTRIPFAGEGHTP